MTWKLKGYSASYAFTEFPTDEFWETPIDPQSRVYRRTFRTTHVANPPVGQAQTTNFTGAGHGIGQVLRVEAVFSNMPGYNGNVPMQFLRTTATQFQFYVLNTVTIPANTILVTVWYTKATGIF